MASPPAVGTHPVSARHFSAGRKRFSTDEGLVIQQQERQVFATTAH
jgi:hypothetical protein